MKIQGTPINNYLAPKWRRRPVFTRAMLALIICMAQIIPLLPAEQAFARAN
jgi:hypothetical protein